ncbi:unnamed protein product, partial [Prorocentrum cordatum]
PRRPPAGARRGGPPLAAAVAPRREARAVRARQGLRVLGMGGMRLAYRGAVGHGAVLPQWRAMDIDETCCKVFSQMFGADYVRDIKGTRRWEYAPGQDEVWQVSIDRMPPEAFEGADLWLMSPPCQPFTKTGKRGDDKDPRSASLLHMLEVLPLLKHPPRALLLENVPPFFGSKTHELTKKALRRCGAASDTRYEVEEVVLDPVTFGFPNTRKRFYLSAVVAGEGSGGAGGAAQVPLPGFDGPPEPLRPVRDFCGPGADRLPVPVQLLQKSLKSTSTVDVATGSSVVTKTFTSNYGKRDFGLRGLSTTGPVLLTEEDGLTPAEHVLERFPTPRDIGEGQFSRLRYFAPREVMALQGFPPDVDLPHELGVLHQWRLIGNSINVAVVQRLLERLLARM